MIRFGWLDKLPWRGARAFHRWLLLIEYSVWATALALAYGVLAAVMELDRGGGWGAPDPWYPFKLVVSATVVFPLTFILPLVAVNVARTYWCLLRRSTGQELSSADCADRTAARVDVWTWLFDCVIAAAVTGLFYALLVFAGSDYGRTSAASWGTRAFFIALVPAALTLARNLVVIGRRAWRDRTT